MEFSFEEDGQEELHKMIAGRAHPSQQHVARSQRDLDPSTMQQHHGGIAVNAGVELQHNQMSKMTFDAVAYV